MRLWLVSDLRNVILYNGRNGVDPRLLPCSSTEKATQWLLINCRQLFLVSDGQTSGQEAPYPEAALLNEKKGVSLVAYPVLRTLSNS